MELRRIAAGALCFATLAVARAQEPAPQPAPTPSGEMPARPADAQRSAAIELAVPRVAGPAELPESRKLIVRQKLVHVVETLRPNVVQLSIEQRVADDVFVAIEASGLVVDPRQGHVVTVGSALEQAARVSVHFAYAPQMRPRRARVLGVDAATDVGVLDVGAVELPALEFAVAPAGLHGAVEADVRPVAAEARFVVTLCGVPDGRDGKVALGWLLDPLPNPTLGQRRFDRLLRVSMARAPQCPGGVLAQQDGRVVGLTLSPAQASGTEGGLLALPAEAMRRGVRFVLANAAERAPAPAPAARAWIGFGGSDLEEPEFLRQLGVPGAVVVDEVFEGSPALAAGLEPHDVILGWNGSPLGGVDALHALLAASSPGQEVLLDCLRRLERRPVKVSLGAW